LALLRCGERPLSGQSTMPEAKIGVIGGSGLYEIAGMTNIEEVKPETPFGEPSDAIVIGELVGSKIAFLPRHGRGHHVSPSEIPSRANIYALKSLGVEWIISVNAVGSLKEGIHPLDLVIPDQIIDRTRSRVNSFFGGGWLPMPALPNHSARFSAIYYIRQPLRQGPMFTRRVPIS